MQTHAFVLDVDQRYVLASATGSDEDTAVLAALRIALENLRHLGRAAPHYLARSCRGHVALTGARRGTGDPLRSYMLASAAWNGYLSRLQDNRSSVRPSMPA